MSEHLLMAHDVHAEEAEPVVVRVLPRFVALVLDDGRELLFDRGELAEAIRSPAEEAEAA